MANWVRIGVIGAAPLTQDPGTGPAAVKHMVEHWRAKLERVLVDRPDLVLVPECSDRYAGQSVEQVQDYYRFRGDQVRDFFSQMAERHRCYIAYAAIRTGPDGSWRNSIQVLDRRGELAGVYDKNYPTIGEMEGLGVRPGSEAPIIRCDFGRVACAICFDLNFDELRLHYARQKPDVILFASMYHGGLMQPYWAYSCRAYLVSAVAGLPSQVIDPLGRIIASSTNYLDYCTVSANLDCALVHLDYHWEKLEALKRAYGPEVSVVDPGYLGSVLISSEIAERTVDDLLAQFEIEPLDDYFARARAARRAHLTPGGREP
jgi:predicted amidohydrolase